MHQPNKANESTQQLSLSAANLNLSTESITTTPQTPKEHNKKQSTSTLHQSITTTSIATTTMQAQASYKSIDPHAVNPAFLKPTFNVAIKKSAKVNDMSYRELIGRRHSEIQEYVPTINHFFG